MNEKTEPTTAELKRHLETIIVGDSRYIQEVCGDALEVIEQQEQRIAELEAENRDIRQNSVSYTTHAEFVSDYQEQIDERDARIAELERIIDERKQKYAVLDTEAAEMRVRIYELERQIETDRAEWEPIWANRCDMQRKRVLDLERALAAVKEDLHHNDACSVCIGADQEVCKDCDRECQTCVLDCRCKDCRDESKWEWRGLPQEGEWK
jgi:chromosome segregation ATPase